jgi:hypothetical protein
VLELVNLDPVADRPSADPQVKVRLELRLIDLDGRVRPLPMDGRATSGFRATATWHPIAPDQGIIRAYEVELLVIADEAVDELGLQVILPLDGPATRFMVPGIVYGENRLESCGARYPRVAMDGSGGDALTSDHWAFRTDRASHGVVFGWTDGNCLALATDEASPLGTSGLGFHGGRTAALLLNFPAREEPVTYLGHDAPSPAEVMTHDWEAGESATVRFQVFLLPAEPHAYDAVLRFLYRRDRHRHQLNPWMDPDEAATLAADGLHRWHYRAGPAILAETVAFHRESDEHALVRGDRDDMHVGWLSGAPAAFALLSFGRAQGIAEYVDAAVSVLDTIAGGRAPCGAFWGRWSVHGWDGGWNGHRDLIHARTIAEATLFMIRAARAEAERGIDHPGWRQAIESNLDFAIRSQHEGAFPALVNGKTGEPERWVGAAGLLWIPALLEGADMTSAGAGSAAMAAGAHYAQFVEDEFIFGAPEDVDLAPSSEDGYNAVMAYVALYETTRDSRWLELARKAADWMLSFRWSYNLVFPHHTLLASYDFRSRGADVASPRNQHLHAYGLICLPEMVRLARHTNDAYYLERTRDNLASALQFIAREDGDFNARRGMVSERYYNSRCFGPKGAILPVSHAWTAGLVLYACQAGLSLEP